MDEEVPRFEFEVVDQNAPLEERKTYDYAVDSPEAQESQEIHAVLADLDFVIKTADYLADLLRGQALLQKDLLPGSGSRIDLVVRSLWTTALVTYVRCFATGTRYSLREADIEEQYPGSNEVGLHRRIKQLRDKHVAHSVSPLETFGTGVKLVEEEDGSLRVERLVSAQFTYGAPAPETAEQLGNLAGYVYGFVKRRFEEASQAALEKAQELSQEQLRNLPALQPDPGRDPNVVRPPRTRGGPSSD